MFLKRSNASLDSKEIADGSSILVVGRGPVRNLDPKHVSEGFLYESGFVPGRKTYVQG